EEAILRVQVDSDSVREEEALSLDPLRVPLILTPFWVQVHDIPIGHSDSFCEIKMEAGVEITEIETVEVMILEEIVDGEVSKRFECDKDIDPVVIGEEGKKRAKGGIEESSNIGGRNRRMFEVTHLLSAAVKRQADWSQ
ncbi:hypothetical protein Golax_010906, partial [Gossypium laxum]|nr:hypothetical protein [Gossypium laxum]